MNQWLPVIVHQALFGGIAAAGFGILFNYPPKLLGLSFASGALALAARTLGTDLGCSLPEATFFAALLVAILDRSWWQHEQHLRRSVLAIVGCIPLVPGSLAARGLQSLFELMRANASDGVQPAMAALENLTIAALTLAAIGTALAIPMLMFPAKRAEE
jgi:uncharacterized membrane protein YjjB (DUF3815 family)